MMVLKHFGFERGFPVYGDRTAVRIASLTVWVLSLMLVGPGQAGQITVVFRYDDYSSVSPTSLEKRIIQCFQERGLCCTFGVIPCVNAADEAGIPGPRDRPLDGEKVALLKEAMAVGAVDPALHGYAHTLNGPWTEFVGLSYDQQAARILKGRNILVQQLGVDITTFIPPWNSYDANTLRVLDELGFACVSGTRVGPVAPAQSSRMKFLPETCTLGDLPNAVRLARCVPDRSVLIVVLFHPYDFAEAGLPQNTTTLDAFARLLDWVGSQTDVIVRSIHDVAVSDEDLSAERFQNNVSLVSLPRWIPPFVARIRRTTPTIYLPSATILRDWYARPRLYLLAAVFYLAAALVSAAGIWFAARTLLPKRYSAILPILRCVGFAVLAAMLAYGLRDLTLGYSCAMACSIALGLCCGLGLRPPVPKTAPKIPVLPPAQTTTADGPDGTMPDQKNTTNILEERATR